jgi:hypothetical protein
MTYIGGGAPALEGASTSGPRPPGEGSAAIARIGYPTR